MSKASRLKDKIAAVFFKRSGSRIVITEEGYLFPLDEGLCGDEVEFNQDNDHPLGAHLEGDLYICHCCNMAIPVFHPVAPGENITSDEYWMTLEEIVSSLSHLDHLEQCAVSEHIKSMYAAISHNAEQDKQAANERD